MSSAIPPTNGQSKLQAFISSQQKSSAINTSNLIPVTATAAATVIKHDLPMNSPIKASTPKRDSIVALRRQAFEQSSNSSSRRIVLEEIDSPVPTATNSKGTGTEIPQNQKQAQSDYKALTPIAATNQAKNSESSESFVSLRRKAFEKSPANTPSPMRPPLIHNSTSINNKAKILENSHISSTATQIQPSSSSDPKIMSPSPVPSPLIGSQSATGSNIINENASFEVTDKSPKKGESFVSSRRKLFEKSNSTSASISETTLIHSALEEQAALEIYNSKPQEIISPKRERGDFVQLRMKSFERADSNRGSNLESPRISPRTPPSNFIQSRSISEIKLPPPVIQSVDSTQLPAVPAASASGYEVGINSLVSSNAAIGTNNNCGVSVATEIDDWSMSDSSDGQRVSINRPIEVFSSQVFVSQQRRFIENRIRNPIEHQHPDVSRGNQTPNSIRQQEAQRIELDVKDLVSQSDLHPEEDAIVPRSGDSLSPLSINSSSSVARQREAIEAKLLNLRAHGESFIISPVNSIHSNHSKSKSVFSFDPASPRNNSAKSVDCKYAPLDKANEISALKKTLLDKAASFESLEAQRIAMEEEEAERQRLLAEKNKRKKKWRKPSRDYLNCDHSDSDHNSSDSYLKKHRQRRRESIRSRSSSNDDITTKKEQRNLLVSLSPESMDDGDDDMDQDDKIEECDFEIGVDDHDDIEGNIILSTSEGHIKTKMFAGNQETNGLKLSPEYPVPTALNPNSDSPESNLIAKQSNATTEIDNLAQLLKDRARHELLANQDAQQSDNQQPMTFSKLSSLRLATFNSNSQSDSPREATESSQAKVNGTSRLNWKTDKVEDNTFRAEIGPAKQRDDSSLLKPSISSSSTHPSELEESIRSPDHQGNLFPSSYVNLTSTESIKLGNERETLSKFSSHPEIPPRSENENLQASVSLTTFNSEVRNLKNDQGIHDLHLKSEETSASYDERKKASPSLHEEEFNRDDFSHGTQPGIDNTVNINKQSHIIRSQENSGDSNRGRQSPLHPIKLWPSSLQSQEHQASTNNPPMSPLEQTQKEGTIQSKADEHPISSAISINDINLFQQDSNGVSTHGNQQGQGSDIRQNYLLFKQINNSAQRIQDKATKSARLNQRIIQHEIKTVGDQEQGKNDGYGDDDHNYYDESDDYERDQRVYSAVHAASIMAAADAWEEAGRIIEEGNFDRLQFNKRIKDDQIGLELELELQQRTYLAQRRNQPAFERPETVTKETKTTDSTKLSNDEKMSTQIAQYDPNSSINSLPALAMQSLIQSPNIFASGIKGMLLIDNDDYSNTIEQRGCSLGRVFEIVASVAMGETSPFTCTKYDLITAPPLPAIATPQSEINSLKHEANDNDANRHINSYIEEDSLTPQTSTSKSRVNEQPAIPKTSLTENKSHPIKQRNPQSPPLNYASSQSLSPIQSPSYLTITPDYLINSPSRHKDMTIETSPIEIKSPPPSQQLPPILKNSPNRINNNTSPDSSLRISPSSSLNSLSSAQSSGIHSPNSSRKEVKFSNAPATVHHIPARENKSKQRRRQYLTLFSQSKTQPKKTEENQSQSVTQWLYSSFFG